jgi:hypothetical protein
MYPNKERLPDLGKTIVVYHVEIISRNNKFAALNVWEHLLSPTDYTINTMVSAAIRMALPFSPAERLLQIPPYIHTSGTVPVKEKDADYVFYQTWTDARVEQKNVDVKSHPRWYLSQLIWIHGLNDYGGRNTETPIDIWLSAGYSCWLVLD